LVEVIKNIQSVNAIAEMKVRYDGIEGATVDE
jgi:hypothetical protein